MARFSRRQFSFTNGEVSPRLFMRADMEFYFASLAECVNFVPDHKGNLVRRPPTQFVTEGKNGEKPCLYPFNVGRDCPVMVVAYRDCFQFILNRELILDGGGAAFELPHTYGDDYCDLEYAQDCGALFLAHENHPKAFIEKDAGTFRLTTVESFPFGEINTDSDCMLCLRAGGAVPNGEVASGTIRPLVSEAGDFITLTPDPIPATGIVETFGAIVQAYSGNEVSIAAFGTSLGGSEVPPPGAYHVIEGGVSVGLVTVNLNHAILDAVGCTPFVTEMIGQQIRILDVDGVGRDEDDPEAGNQPNTWITTTVIGFNDAGQVVTDYDGLELACTDLFQLPAYTDGVFPETVWIHQDRLFCASDNQIVASKTGNFFDFEPTDPDGTVNPDNAIYRRISSGQCADIRWFWPMGRHLLTGTSEGLYSLLGSGTNGAFAADAVTEQRNQNIGVADIRPVQVADGVFFVDRTRTKLYGTAFSGQYDHIGAEEYSLFADHITDWGIKKIAYQEDPYSVIWGVTDGGTLFSITTVPGQGVRGWARHELGGQLIKDHCCCVPEVCDVEGLYGPSEDEDDVFLVVKRTINGADRYYIEVMSSFFSEADNHVTSGHLDSYLDLGNITGDNLPVVGDGPSAFPAPTGALTDDFAVFDGERWYKYEVENGGAHAVAPNTYETPIAGRDWVSEDALSWDKVPKVGLCDDPEFVSEAQCVFRQPCGVQEWAVCVDGLAGLDHLAGEDVLIYSDGQMFPETISATGTVDRGGCVVRAGFPYESRLRLLPYRQALGSTDGAADPQRPFRININVMGAVWVEVGTGEHDEYNQQNQQWLSVEIPAADFDAPEPFTGWIGSDLLSGFNDNSDSQVALRVRGPWPTIIRSIEAQIVASGGR